MSSNGLVLIGMPQQTMDIVKAIALKSSKSMVDVLSEAIDAMAKKHLSEQELNGVKGT